MLGKWLEVHPRAKTATRVATCILLFLLGWFCGRLGPLLPIPDAFLSDADKKYVRIATDHAAGQGLDAAKLTGPKVIDCVLVRLGSYRDVWADVLMVRGSGQFVRMSHSFPSVANPRVQSDAATPGEGEGRETE